MFTINFKRELARCCCLKPSIKGKNYGTLVHYRSSNQRTDLKLTSSCGMNSKYYKESEISSSVVDCAHHSPNIKRSISSHNILPTMPSASKGSNDSRANINNFMTLKIPVEDDSISSVRDS